MRIYYRRYLSFARIRGEEEKKNGARWKIKAEEAYIWTIHLRQFLFFLFFIRAHEGAKCKVSKEKGPGVTMSIVPPTGIFSTEMKQQMGKGGGGAKKSWFKKRWKSRRWRRWEVWRIYARIWNTSFGFLISSSSVEWTVFRDILSLPIPSKLGGEKN